MRRRSFRQHRADWPAAAARRSPCRRAGLGASQWHWIPRASFGFPTSWALHCACLVVCMVAEQQFTSSRWIFLDIARCSAHRVGCFSSAMHGDGLIIFHGLNPCNRLLGLLGYDHVPTARARSRHRSSGLALVCVGLCHDTHVPHACESLFPLRNCSSGR